MPDSFPMVARCAARQPADYGINTCACGELKRVGYWRCAACVLRDEAEGRTQPDTWWRLA
jgi:hypothetical protein